ncbi:MAG: tetratricopeptide repeat protein [Actinomycetes bacterium]
MTEPSPVVDENVPSGTSTLEDDDGPASPASPARTSEAKLRRILRILVIAAIALFAVFAVVYYLGQRAPSAPSISDRSVAAAEQAVRDNPNNVSARLALANAYVSADRKDEAITQYKTILQADPKNRGALLGAGKLAYATDDYVSARDWLTQMVKVSGGEEFSSADPQLEETQYFLGMTEMMTGNMPSAITHLKAALAIDKTDADAWHSLAGAQVRQGDYKAAVASYQQAVRFIPSGWCDPYQGLAVAYQHLNDAAGTTYAQGMTSICAGDTQAGMDSLATLTTGPFATPAMLGLGLAAESLNDPSAAAKWYSKVLKADPSNITARTALARLGATASPSPAASGGKS